MLAIALAPLSASAQDGGGAAVASDEVQLRYERGKAALADGEPEVALRHFRACLGEVVEDQPRGWQMQLAVALAYERMRRTAAAIEHYGAFMAASKPHELALSAKWQRRREYVAATLQRLRGEVMATRGQISVASAPPGAAVFLDGSRAGAEGDAVTPFAVFARRGQHEVVVRLDGYQDGVAAVDVAVGRFHPVSVELREREPTASEPPLIATTSVGPTGVVERSDSAGIDVLSWVLLGGGTALTLTSVGVGVGVAETARQQRALGDGEAARWDKLEDKRVPMLVSSIVLGASGLAMLGVGIGCAVGGCGTAAADDSHEAELLGLGVSPLREGAWVGATIGF